jgi:3-hydroxyacyl-[acyl-carrier-protein] dehydratase
MSEVVTRRSVAIASDHPAFDGHFPGQPVLPGVALLAEVLEAALHEPTLASRIGAAPRLAVVKFLAPVQPGAVLAIDLRLCERAIEWRVGDGSRDVASGQIVRADLDPGERR